MSTGQNSRLCTVATGDCKAIADGGFRPRWSRDGTAVYYIKRLSPVSFELYRATPGLEPSKVAVLEPLLPVGFFYDVTSQGQIAYVEYEQGRSELWQGDLD